MQPWEPYQQNTIKFVLVDTNNSEVEGLGSSFTLEIDSPADPGFKSGGGTKSEIGGGWYQYVATVAEASAASGVIAIKVSGAGIVQQNLEYVLRSRVSSLCEFQYQVTDAGSGDALQGVRIEVSTDADRTNLIWSGWTDAFGYARDDHGNHPFLPEGTLYFWRYKSGYSFNNPDTETVSAS